MDDDARLRDIMRKEAAERATRILAAVRAPPSPERWREVYRHAHTLAGIAPDDETAAAARRLASLLTDERGHVQAPTGEAGDEARTLAERLAQRWPDRGA